jgi:polyhydroxybutyrate depolymerase
MKLALFLSLFMITNMNAQLTIDDSIMHNGSYRFYKLYVPAIYNPANSVPLVFNFHGYGSNSFEQMNYGDFRGIADTANFIIVHPQGTLDGSGTTFFNIGQIGATVDDIGFTNALIDKLQTQYTIDSSQIYSTGMSNGGFMSLSLACELSNRFAAVASVTGSMVPISFSSCSASHPMPVMQIHGTVDPTVPYTGIVNFSAPIVDVLDFWSEFNECEAPITSSVPNSSLTDGCTAEKTIYSNGQNCSEVIHYKIIGGAHTWPGSAFTIGVTNQDVKASKEIWSFFRKYALSGQIGCETTNAINDNAIFEFSISPNPSASSISVHSLNADNSFLEIFDLSGKKIIQTNLNAETTLIDLSFLAKGHYFVRVGIHTKVLIFE